MNGWVPLLEVDYDRWKEFAKPHCDTTSHSHQIAIFCLCDNDIRIDKGDDHAVVCEKCGRVYRVKETRSYVVEEYLGGR
jgi:uncharacterized protein YbaR (Trm112 family)